MHVCTIGRLLLPLTAKQGSRPARIRAGETMSISFYFPPHAPYEDI
jgi:hypothetical protein